MLCYYFSLLPFSQTPSCHVVIGWDVPPLNCPPGHVVLGPAVPPDNLSQDQQSPQDSWSQDCTSPLRTSCPPVFYIVPTHTSRPQASSDFSARACGRGYPSGPAFYLLLLHVGILYYTNSHISSPGTVRFFGQGLGMRLHIWLFVHECMPDFSFADVTSQSHKPDPHREVGLVRLVISHMQTLPLPFMLTKIQMKKQL